MKKLKSWWDVTQAIGETVCKKTVSRVVREVFGSSYSINIYETSKDEVLQVYNNDECYTFIGGSSADKSEWRSNFDAFPLVDGNIHGGFYDSAMEVVENRRYIKRNTMYYGGHSRGSAISSILCYLYGCKGVGFGTPKAFRKHVDVLGFVNVVNPLDPVCHVVPFFRQVGDVRKKRFFRNPHTQYGRHIDDTEEVSWKSC